MENPQILVHSPKDNVGVVVVEDLKPATEMLCVVTEDDSSFRITPLSYIPIGHKIALKDLSPNDSAIQYGEDIGRIVAPVAKGGHVHAHNLKTKRW